MNLYGFVGNDGVNSWDMLGLQGVGDQTPRLSSKEEFLDVRECGAFSWRIWWKPSGQANLETGGLIQQKVIFQKSQRACGEGGLSGDIQKEFYELWHVHPPTRTNPGGLVSDSPEEDLVPVGDTFANVGRPGTCGRVTIIGLAQYHPEPGKTWNELVDELGIIDYRDFSSLLPSGTFPAYPVGPASNTHMRSITVQWNCCDGSADKHTKVVEKVAKDFS